MTIISEEGGRPKTTITEQPQQQRPNAANASRAAMSLTYSDFLYTRNDYSDSEMYYNEDGEVLERRRLPSEFQPIQETEVPLMQENDAPANYDFIIVAEFSELEGPIPLCTIPSSAAETTDINLNDFVVHLMSTDYQVNSVGQFRICQDTQVVKKNVFPHVHVFMQYFTLYDLKARGFVRPFCFGYVTKDHVKLDKYMKFLVSEFGKVTSVLEYCNREWFSYELTLYLEKLQNAKESYIQKYKNEVEEEEEEFQDSDTITLSQIAHQYSEMQNILKTVQSFENPNLAYAENLMSEMKCFFTEENCKNEVSPSSKPSLLLPLSSLLNQIDIKFGYNDLPPETLHSLSESMNIPLIYPLRLKGQPLRPLTTMGQMGSVYLVGKLMQLCNGCKMDIIFSDMTEATLSFRQHFANLKLQEKEKRKVQAQQQKQSPELDLVTVGVEATEQIDFLSDEEVSPGKTKRFHKQSISEVSPFEIIKDESGINQISSLILNLNKNELQQIIEKLHTPQPVLSDNGSGSYHTVSEEDSDLNNTPTSQSQQTSETTTTTPPKSQQSQSSSSASATAAKRSSPITSTGGGDSPNTLKLSSLTSFSSDEDMSLTSSPIKASSSLAENNSEELILKEPWWVYASQKLVRGVPGYGLANFFRRYHTIAHHVLYSILLCRPIIICGEEKMSRRIGRIITALIPLVPVLGGPGFNSKSIGRGGEKRKSWKLLRWHRGILVQSHIETYRLIGLCIPEKLEVHDLIPPRLLTLVTIISAEKKTILGGPAYSGDIFQNFEKRMQEHFYNSDVAFLSYIGTIYADLEGKVYMYKCLAEKYKVENAKVGNNAGIYLLFKELNLRASDAEIIKYLSNLIDDPSECVNIL